MDRVQEMRRMRFEDNSTLQEIADKYGISRERVRQLIGNSGRVAWDKMHRVHAENKHLGNSVLAKLMGLATRSVYHYRNGERHDIEGGMFQIGSENEILVSNKLSSLGIGNKLMPHHHPFDILLNNGIRVDVKSSSKTLSGLYKFQIKKVTRGEYADFFILVPTNTKDMFVVPGNKAPDYGIFISWPPKNSRSKYAQYLNRFDLLKG